MECIARLTCLEYLNAIPSRDQIDADMEKLTGSGNTVFNMYMTGSYFLQSVDRYLSVADYFRHQHSSTTHHFESLRWKMFTLAIKPKFKNIHIYTGNWNLNELIDYYTRWYSFWFDLHVVALPIYRGMVIAYVGTETYLEAFNAYADMTYYLSVMSDTIELHLLYLMDSVIL